MIRQKYQDAQPQEGERTTINTPTYPHPQVDPARFSQCLASALRFLRGDKSLNVKLIKRQSNE